VLFINLTGVREVGEVKEVKEVREVKEVGKIGFGLIGNQPLHGGVGILGIGTKLQRGGF
jgi:hypothetical protein